MNMAASKPCILDNAADMSWALWFSHYNILIISAEGTVRILRYTSFWYHHPTCIAIMSCWCSVSRELNIESLLSTHSWRGAFLISLRFSAYLIRLSYQGSQNATKSLLGFSLARRFVLWSLHVFGVPSKWLGPSICGGQALRFSCIIENTNPYHTGNWDSCKIMWMRLVTHLSPARDAVPSLLSFPTFHLVNAALLSAYQGMLRPESI